MNLLLTNDDGIKAKGILSIAKALSKDNNILLAAPDSERSGSGHSTSFKTPIKYQKTELIEGAKCYALNGTPTDCVKFGLNFLAKEKIDMVISGINHGRNLGTDVIYSGTANAAIEGIIQGYSAIALSYSGIEGYDFDFAADFVAKNLKKLYHMSAKKRVININFPKCKKEEVKGVVVTPLGREAYNHNYVMFKKGDENQGYIMEKMPHTQVENPDNCDIMLNAKKYITITPLGLDLTDYKAITEISTKDIIL